ncbi:MAG: dihydropteroate synthase [bacterium]|nr:dihydropteroate synthase [bacterium]
MHSKFILRCGKHTIDLRKKPALMGILNVTPDSFSDGGLYNTRQKAINRVDEMVAEGADIIDIGGESTRPSAEPVSEKEESARVISLIKEIVKKFNLPVSIDTRKTEVAKKALDAGACMVNNVGGLKGNRGLGKIVAHYDVPIILMHMRGNPQTMQREGKYRSVVSDIIEELKSSIALAQDAGIREDNILVDPGIGFGKTTEDNLKIINRISEFKILGKPVVLGPSRKSFIGNVLNLDVKERLEGTLAAVAYAVLKDVSIIRVHDVVETRRVIDMIKAIKDV